MLQQEEVGSGVTKQQPLYSGAKVASAPEAAATKAEELGPAHGGSNEDMKKVLMELDNTGYFDEVGSILRWNLTFTKFEVSQSQRRPL